nr:uncharacterized PKHD-type hydroxylase At1g22950-like [Tanacetum cinerariifolium]
MIAYLTKSDASEGFNQIIDFLNESSIKYALTVNPNIYVSCIKQFWTTVAVNKVNDVTRLQALVDKKKAVVMEGTIRDALSLDDAEGVECLSNEEIFVELARMGYEKPSTKLTFYKAFFSSQWKFLIHTILQCMSAKRTSWNEFSSSMASAVICLSLGRKFNFSKYILDNLVRNVDSPIKFYMYPCFLQLMIRKQVGDLSTHTTKYTSPALTQKVFANMRRVGKGFFGVETPLFEGIIVEQQVAEGADEVHDEGFYVAGVATEGVVSVPDDVVPVVDEEPSIPSPTPPTPPPQPSQDIPSTSQDVVLEDAKDVVADIVKDDQDAEVDESADIQGRKAKSQAEIYKIDLKHAKKVLSMQEEESEPSKLQEVVDVVTTAKIITEVVTAASTTITAVDVQVSAVTTVAALTLTAAPSKEILVEEPKPLKKQAQIEQDEKYARELEAELNRTIDWDEVIDHVHKKAKEDNTVERYQAIKRKAQTKAQVRKNMMIYLKNVVGLKMDYFKGMTYDDILPVFEKYFDSNIERRYPLTRFTLDQMLNNVRLEVEEESEVSLELLRVRRQRSEEPKSQSLLRNHPPPRKPLKVKLHQKVLKLDPLTFNDLMATPIDFYKYVLNRLKIENLTQDVLLGPAYNLLKGMCSSSIELEYNFQECFNALTDKLDWNNPKRDRYPFDLSKPLRLQGHPGHLTVAADYFFNNDLEYMKSFDPKRTYTTSIMKIKAARYKILGIEDMKILGVKSVSVKKLHGYGHLEEVMVKRADRQLYKFKEGDFVDLYLDDIEDMLILDVQHKLFHLNESDIVDFIVALWVIYEVLTKQKLVMRADELYKFSDGTLKKVQDKLHHRILDFHLGYNEEIRYGDNVSLKWLYWSSFLRDLVRKPPLLPLLQPSKHESSSYSWASRYGVSIGNLDETLISLCSRSVTTITLCIMHRGRHRHGARATTTRDRINLLLWCRSYVFRELRKHQKEFESWCGEC